MGSGGKNQIGMGAGVGTRMVWDQRIGTWMVWDQAWCGIRRWKQGGHRTRG